MFYLLLTTLLSSLSFAQNPNYELKGSFGKNTETKNPIEFTLTWTEKEGQARGFYKDNFYGSTDSVRGITGDLGRLFLVTFSKPTRGVRSITFLASDVKDPKEKIQIPLSVVARDDDGNPVTTVAVTGDLVFNRPAGVTGSRSQAQAQQERPCQEGFGDLAGACGVYSGMANEEDDEANRCDLTANGGLRLGISDQGSVVVMMGAPSEIVETPAHNVGRLPADIDRRTVDILNRECRPLPGTTFPGDDCKILDLRGEFSDVRGKKHFTGTYTIINEMNQERCRYRLSLDQET